MGERGVRVRASAGALMTAALAGVTALHGGCDGSARLFDGFAGDDVALSSPHFYYHARRSDLPRPCGDTLDDLERHFETMRAFFGFPWAAGSRIHYWRFADVFALQATGVCGPQLPACASGLAVYSTETLHEHELVHTYLAPLGHPPAFMVEGLAELVTCDYPPPTDGLEAAALVAALPSDWARLATWTTADDWEHSAPLYRLSAELARFLIDQFGVARVTDYYASASPSSDAAAVDAEFQAAFGLTLLEALTSALGRTLRDGPCLRPFACGAPPAIAGTESVAVTCARADLYRRVDVPEAGSVLATVQAAALLAPEPFIRSCDGGPSPRDGRTGVRDGLGAQWTDLASTAAGSYVIGLPSPPYGFDLTTEIDVAANGHLSSDCAVALAAPLRAQRGGLQINAQTGRPPAYIGLSMPPGSLVTVTAAAGAGSLCDGCDAAATCMAVAEGNGFSAELSGPYVLRMAPPLNQRSYVSFSFEIDAH